MSENNNNKEEEEKKVIWRKKQTKADLASAKKAENAGRKYLQRHGVRFKGDDQGYQDLYPKRKKKNNKEKEQKTKS